MTILDLLFGRKKFSSDQEIYFANLLKQINACESVNELAEYARDYSGYVREAAIKRCANLALPTMLPIVVSRLNDWVPIVRQSAQSAFSKLMPFASASQLCTVLPDILHLRKTRRVDHQEWIELVEQKLIKQVSVQEFINAVENDNVKIARACFYILTKYELHDFNSLINLVLEKQNDIVLAIEALQLVDNLNKDDQCEQYLKAMQSHFGAVRTIALNELLMLDEKTYDQVEKDMLAVDVLLDPQSSVRSIAMHYLEGRGFDLNEYYQCALDDTSSSAKQIQVSLISLANLKNNDNVNLIKSFAKAEKPSIRKVALLCWLKIAEGDKDVIALEALKDESASIRKLSLQIVRKYGAYIPFATVHAILQEKSQLDLLLHFSKSRKWDWLECIARIAIQAEPDSAIRPLLITFLDEWISQGAHNYEAPNPEQFNFLRSEIAKSALINLIGAYQKKIAFLEFALTQMTDPQRNPKN
jgi:HEAT repeat protein